jgi:hypothetical protein
VTTESFNGTMVQVFGQIQSFVSDFCEHGQLGITLAFPPLDVGGGNFTVVLEVA